MKIILLQDIRKLGRAGELKDVAEGYARNYLLREKLAEIATDRAVAHMQSIQIGKEQSLPQKRAAVGKLLDKLRSRTLEFIVPGDRKGHLYAGLKESEILAKISEGDETQQKSLKLESYVPLKKAGQHEITVNVPGAGHVQAKISLTPSQSPPHEGEKGR